MMLAVINNVMLKEFSRRHSACLVAVRQAQSMRMMAPVATVFPFPNALKMRSDLIPRTIAVRITAVVEFSKNNVTIVPVRRTQSVWRMTLVVANVYLQQRLALRSQIADSA